MLSEDILLETMNRLSFGFSAGVGRTGTFIALDILMEKAIRDRVIDVPGTILDIRKDRYHLVQSEVKSHHGC